MQQREVLAPTVRGSVENDPGISDRAAVAPSTITTRCKGRRGFDGEWEVELDADLRAFGEVAPRRSRYGSEEPIDLPRHAHESSFLRIAPKMSHSCSLVTSSAR